MNNEYFKCGLFQILSIFAMHTYTYGVYSANETNENTPKCP